MGKLVKFQRNDGEISGEICELIEVEKDICRIKRDSGEIIRIYSDRIFYVDAPDLNDENKTFDPWLFGDDVEVWVKSNHFSDTVICETYAIIDNDSYISHNVYNGISKSKSDYKIPDIKKLRDKLSKKGYKKIEK